MILRNTAAVKPPKSKVDEKTFFLFLVIEGHIIIDLGNKLTQDKMKFRMIEDEK